MDDFFNIYENYDVFCLNKKKGICFQKHFTDEKELLDFINDAKSLTNIHVMFVSSTIISKGFLKVM